MRFSECEWSSCERPKSTLGLCHMHYLRQRRGADMDAPVRRPRGLGVRACSRDGCDELARALGMCQFHYDRTRRGLPVDAPRRGGGYLDGRGYRIVGRRKKAGPIFEHRVVMEAMLGRPLEPHETVHHKNGVRHDNRPENLELWLRQPPGQRIDDLIDFITTFYRAEVEARLGVQRRTSHKKRHATDQPHLFVVRGDDDAIAV